MDKDDGRQTTMRTTTRKTMSMYIWRTTDMIMMIDNDDDNRLLGRYKRDKYYASRRLQQ